MQANGRGTDLASAEHPDSNGTSDADLGAIDDPAGIDRMVFAALMRPMPPQERVTIIALCRRDLGEAGARLEAAVVRRETTAMQRQLHIVLSLAKTIGAADLAHQTERMQDLVRTGELDAMEAEQPRIDRLLRQTCDFLDGPSVGGI